MRKTTIASDADAELETQRRRVLMREGALLLGFLAVLIAAVVTVALPELSDAPDEEEAGKPPATAEAAAPSTTPPP